MIQRIQSLFLSLALIVTGSLFYLNMADLITASHSLILKYKGLIDLADKSEQVASSLPLTILLWVATVLLVLTIFLYKNRRLQLRICGLNLGFHAGLSILIFYYGKFFAKQLGAELSFNWPLVLPLVSIVLMLLAMRGILRDELLVKSLDRIR